MPILKDYGIVELSTPNTFIGKSLKELDLINRFGIQVIAIKELIPDQINMVPRGSFVLKESDILIILGPKDSLEQLEKASN